MTRELWEREYVSHSISSSTNPRPSHGTQFLRRNMARIVSTDGPRRLLDMGCGGGRNVEVLAETGFEYFGMDFAYRPLTSARARAGGDRLRLVQASMAAPLPFGSGMFSLVTAFTSVENVVEDELIRALAQEVRRVLCPRGLFYVYFLTTEDSYYQPLVSRGADGRSLTYDPVTELRQRVYQISELSALFSTSFELLTSEQFAFEDIRSGGTYHRRLAAGLWQRD